MKNLDRDIIDFGNGNIPQMFAKMLIPTIFGMLFSALFCITDGIFIGHGVGSDGLASVNIVLPIFTLAVAFGMMSGMGSSVIAAIHLSQGNIKAARIITTQAFLATLVVGVIIGGSLYSFADKMLVLLGCGDKLTGLCRDYYLWFIPCALFVMIQILGQFVIRLDGNPRYSMMVEVVPACLNMFLDWLFIFPLGWGLKGAACATSIGSLSGVVMVIFYMTSKCRTLALYRLKHTLTSLVLTLRNIAYMVRAGISGFIGQFSISVMTLAGNYMFMKMLGENGVAAFSIACYLTPVVFMIYAAISQSAQPIISYNFGAGAYVRVRRTFRLAIVAALAAGLSLSATLVFLIKPVVSVFLNTETAAYDICVAGMPLYSIGFVFMAFSQTVVGFCQSINKSGISTLLTLMRGMVLPVCAFLLLPALMGVNGLWLSVPLAELLVAVLICLLYRQCLKL